MAYGFGGGLGQGFSSGVNAGVNMADARLRRQALMKEETDNKVNQAQELVQQGLKSLAETTAQIPQRSGAVDQMVNSQLDMFRQTANMIQQLPGGEQAGRFLLNQVETFAPHILTSSELATRKAGQITQNYTAAEAAKQGVMAGTPSVPPVSAPLPHGPTGQPGGLPLAADGPLPEAAPQQVANGPVPAPGGETLPPVNVPQGDIYPGMPEGWVPPSKGNAGLAAALNQGMGLPADKFSEERAKARAKGMEKEREDALSANKLVTGIKEGLKIADEGMITGFGADIEVMLTKAGHRLGWASNEKYQRATNSEKFAAVMAAPVAQIIRQFGAGTGLSDADREFARQAAAADITMTEDAIRDMLYIQAKGAFNVISQYNKQDPTNAIPIDPVIYETFMRGPQSEAFQQIRQQMAESGKDPDGMTWGQSAQAKPTAKVQPPKGAVDYLRANPDAAAQFESKYGISATEFLKGQ